MDNGHTDFRKINDDIIYFDSSITNNSKNEAKEQFFSQTRPNNILDKANDYYLSVVRFSIPHDSVAVFNFDQDEYYVVIKDTAVQLIYQSRGNPTENIDNLFRGIYTFQQFLDSINIALETAHNAEGLPGNPPIMDLNDTTGIFSLNVDTNYDPAVDFIYFNYPLYNLFLGMDAEFISYNAVDRKDYRMNYKYNFDNIFQYNPLGPLTGTYYKLGQETKSQFLFSNIKYIIITSNTIPANKEFLGLSNFTSNDELQAISDFIPIQKEFENYDRSPWIYTTESPRLVDLQSDIPLRKIDFQIFLVNVQNIKFPLTLAPGESIDVKFAFYKKSLYNNEYDGVFDYKYNQRPNGLHKASKIDHYRY